MIKMKKKKSADHIANLIVKLVEHTDGPVTLARIARDIPGFAAKYESYAYSYQFGLASGTRLIWSDMTKAGVDALDLVLGGRRVAIQFVSVLPYKAAGHVLEDENWWPTVLLPARAANLETPSWLIRASQEYRDYTIAQAAEGRISDHRPLKAHPVYGRPKQGGQSNAR